MSASFADSFYYVALLNPRDAAHSRAKEVTSELSGRIVTTEWILVEVANILSPAARRASAVRLLDMLNSDRNVTIIRSGRSLFARGAERYRQRTDKDWSLTDCISFIVMEDRGLREALTGDHHFEQAGFIALLK